MQYSFLIPAVILLIASWVQAATSKPSSTQPKSIDAILLNSKNEKVGTATLTGLANGVKIDLSAWGLPPGKHAIHLHEKGKCVAPEFTSAGEHYNPTGKQHGFGTAGGAHLGDLPNLIVGDDGKVQSEMIAENVHLEGNPSLLAHGATLVVHEKADDDQTQPSGDSGGRIACGEIKI